MAVRLTHEEMQLVISMENYHIGGHLDMGVRKVPGDRPGLCLHRAGSEREVFLEEAAELGISDDRAMVLVETYWRIPCHLWQ